MSKITLPEYEETLEEYRDMLIARMEYYELEILFSRKELCRVNEHIAEMAKPLGDNLAG